MKAFAAPAYRKTHGAALTTEEAAQLLTRAAQGENLTHVPVKTPGGYRLAHRTTLSFEEREDFARRTRAVAAALAVLNAPRVVA